MHCECGVCKNRPRGERPGPLFEKKARPSAATGREGAQISSHKQV